MSMTKRGSRPIVVDGNEYRWRIRCNPTYCQGCEWRNMTVAVERFDDPGSMLMIDTNRLRLDSWISPSHDRPVTPSEIARCIRGGVSRRVATRGCWKRIPVQTILRNIPLLMRCNHGVEQVSIQLE